MILGGAVVVGRGRGGELIPVVSGVRAGVPIYLAVFKECDRGEAVIGEEVGRHPKRRVDALDVVGCCCCVCR